MTVSPRNQRSRCRDICTSQLILYRLMKYYLVNYLILQDKKVLESEEVYIPVHGFANIPEFKQTIARSKKATNPETVVIKSYLQVSPEEYNRLNNASA